MREGLSGVPPQYAKTYKVIFKFKHLREHEISVDMFLTTNQLSVSIDNLIMLAKEQVKNDLVFSRIEGVQ